MSTPPLTCELCHAATGFHAPGRIIHETPCGCEMVGPGLLPNPWHIHFCPLHAAAPELVEVLDLIIAVWDHHGEVVEEHERRARAALRRARGEGTGFEEDDEALTVERRQRDIAFENACHAASVLLYGRIIRVQDKQEGRDMIHAAFRRVRGEDGGHE